MGDDFATMLMRTPYCSREHIRAFIEDNFSMVDLMRKQGFMRIACTAKTGKTPGEHAIDL